MIELKRARDNDGGAKSSKRRKIQKIPRITKQTRLWETKITKQTSLWER